jgi:hypothetical protein
MSIALSVSLQPSRYARTCVMLLVLALWLQGLWLLLYMDFPIWQVCVLGLTLFAAGVWLGYAGQKILQAHHLTILPNGQIVLTSERIKACVVRLHASSTLWPQALFLRLQDANGIIYPVLVLADCVSASELRALLVSCRWIMVRDRPKKNL